MVPTSVISPLAPWSHRRSIVNAPEQWWSREMRSLSLSLGLPPTRAEGLLNEIPNRIQFVFDSEFYLAALLPLCRAAQERERE